MGSRMRNSRFEEQEYTEFLRHIKEEKEDTSNFAKTLLALVVGVLITLALGLCFVQNEALVVNVFGEDSFITQEVLKVSEAIKSHRKTNGWSLFGRQKNILLLGIDSNGEGTDHWKGTRSDTIIVLNVDPGSHTVNAISIPRDSKVYISGRTSPDKINAAHAYGGVETTKQTIEDTLGIKIDRYICVHDDVVKEVVDALGGVPIFVEKRMKYDDYTAKLHINLERGNQVLSGEQAVGYLRFRHDGLGDIGRTQRQQWFLRGFLERMHSPAVIAKIPQIVGVAKKYIKTDMSIYELTQLAAIAKGFHEGDIQVAMLPGAPSASGSISYWILNPEQVQDVINRLIYREEPTADYTSEIVGGIIYTSSSLAQAEALKSQLVTLGYKVNMMELPSLPHTQFIAHNNKVTNSFYRYLKDKVSFLKSVQYVYDPVRLYCVGGCDFTIVVSNK